MTPGRGTPVIRLPSGCGRCDRPSQEVDRRGGGRRVLLRGRTLGRVRHRHVPRSGRGVEQDRPRHGGDTRGDRPRPRVRHGLVRPAAHQDGCSRAERRPPGARQGTDDPHHPEHRRLAGSCRSRRRHPPPRNDVGRSLPRWLRLPRGAQRRHSGRPASLSDLRWVAATGRRPVRRATPGAGLATGRCRQHRR